ncbi:winged helix-turn-helix domain-containing protein [Haloglomus litoreum]|uniref:winged helix-turn-helix domain-containing protein n=1 Tax=Haloglomus litoreum TaxID=3034026 RepID=UPI0023E85FA2|nr:helix-turn-helix domain-containing protein [Haloglomus sp. DT116]
MSGEYDTGSGAISVERRSPEAVFGLLGDESRLRILQALGETPDEPVPFAELHRRSEVADSGRFNYHLGKLRGTFVRRTDDGYELTYAGRQVIGAMYAGVYTANATVDAIPVEEGCPACGGDLVAEYAAETARVDCTACDAFRNDFAFPPGSLDQFDRTELPLAFDRWMNHVIGGVIDGFCYTCAGRMSGRLVVDEPDGKMGGLPAHAEFECDRCGSTATTSGAAPMMHHPAVAGFLYDHGFESGRTPTWELGEVGLPRGELLAESPPRMAVRLEHGDERVTATLEADASVSSVERTSA